MFGFFASPCRCGLDAEEADAYGGHFCGLANRLSTDYGRPARLLVNRDSAFLSFFMSALAEAESASTLTTCCNPLGKKRPRHQTGDHAGYAAAVTVCGLWAKLQDEMDDGTWLGRPVFRLAAAAARSLAEAAIRLLRERRFPVEETRLMIAGQTALEKRIAAGVSDPAESSRPTAAAYSAIYRHAAENSGNRGDSEAAAFFGEHLGQAVYWHDAAVDRERDRRRGRFNPWLLPGVRLPGPAERLEGHFRAMGEAIAALRWRRYRKTIEEVALRLTPRKAYASAGIEVPVTNEAGQRGQGSPQDDEIKGTRRDRCWRWCDCPGCDCCPGPACGGGGGSDCCPCDCDCPGCSCDC